MVFKVLAAVAAATFGVGGAAQAATVVAGTYSFSGKCTDCSGTGTGTLNLQGYTPGSQLTASNILSFNYSSGSLGPANLTAPFTVGTPSVLGVTTGYYDVDFTGTATLSGKTILPGDQYEFKTSGSDGSWSFLVKDPSSGATTLDFGTAGTWSLANAVSSAPEPSTWLFMLTGAGAAGMAMRRARRHRSDRAGLA